MERGLTAKDQAQVANKVNVGQITLTTKPELPERGLDFGLKLEEEPEKEDDIRQIINYSQLKNGGFMPGFNQKGPMGEGPMTGRKMGKCTNYGAGAKSEQTQKSENPGEIISDDFPGRGFGRRGLGRRFGRQNRFRGGF